MIWGPAVGVAAAAMVMWFVLPRNAADAPRSVPPVQTMTTAPVVQAPPAVTAPPAQLADVSARPSRRAEENTLAALADALPPIDPIAIEPVPPSSMALIELMPSPMPVRIEQLEIERLYFE